MDTDDDRMRAAVGSWRISPVTSLLVRWLMPAVGELMDALVRGSLHDLPHDCATEGCYGDVVNERGQRIEAAAYRQALDRVAAALGASTACTVDELVARARRLHDREGDDGSR